MIITDFPPGTVEVISQRLYWVTLAEPPLSRNGYHYFSIDQEFVYEPFFYDFGPLNLAHLYRYCKHVQSLLLRHRVVIHYTSTDEEKRANAGFLMAAYQVICLRRSSDDAIGIFKNVESFLNFRDASCGACHYECTITDCIKGIEYAIKLGWFDLNTFDLVSYEYYEKVEQGDMTWIVPHKFLAFASPSAEPMDADGFSCMTPTDFVPIFKSANIGMVIRLNKRSYDRRLFIKSGIKHIDMYYLDGSCPTREVITKFLEICETERRAIAVHCKAGLGRTGSLIGLYCMKHYNFPARWFIGWNRICRPGSILGPQQQFLSEMQEEMFQAGILHRRNPLRTSITPTLPTSSLTQLNDRKYYEGDKGQGNRLNIIKRERAQTQLLTYH